MLEPRAMEARHVLRLAWVVAPDSTSLLWRLLDLKVIAGDGGDLLESAGRGFVMFCLVGGSLGGQGRMRV